MSGVSELQSLLLDELATGVRTVQGLLSHVDDSDWAYQPAPNMRSLLDLANHLAQVPAVDLAILQEQSQESVQALEKELTVHSAEELSRVLDEGFAAYKSHMTSLSESDFLSQESKPFYSDAPATQAKWLVETVTHFFHHRAQLFNYLKQLQKPVNMFNLY